MKATYRASFDDATRYLRPKPQHASVTDACMQRRQRLSGMTSGLQKAWKKPMNKRVPLLNMRQAALHAGHGDETRSKAPLQVSEGMCCGFRAAVIGLVYG